MLCSIREDCGLGNPPSVFTINASESMNAILKHKVDHKKSDISTFIQKVKELTSEQMKEIERAVIDRGKYKFKEGYSFLQVDERKWFTMTVQQRTSHLKKVHSTHVLGPNKSSSDATFGRSEHALTVTAESAASTLGFAVSNVEGIWHKATTLLQKEDAIVPAPGQHEKARMVLSYSNKLPHMVTPNKRSGSYSCDSKCPNWKSQNLCSHTVAVAELNGELSMFISSLKKRKITPSVTELVTCKMPKGRGQKGGISPRSRQCKTIQGNSEICRIPLNPLENKTPVESLEDDNRISPLPPSSSAPSFSSATQSFGHPFNQTGLPSMYGTPPYYSMPSMYGAPLPFQYYGAFSPTPSYVPHETSNYGTPIHTPYDESSSFFYKPFRIMFYEGKYFSLFWMQE